MPLLMLHCPVCHDASLCCAVMLAEDGLTVQLAMQGCLCDPYDAWEEVWEEAREMVDEGRVDE